MKVISAAKLPQTVERWRPLVEKYFPANQVDSVLRVANCESFNAQWGSGGDENAIGDTTLEFRQDGELYGYSVGLLQIRRLKGRPSREYLLNPENNVAYAAMMWHNSGFSPWTCAKHLGLVK